MSKTNGTSNDQIRYVVGARLLGKDKNHKKRFRVSSCSIALATECVQYSRDKLIDECMQLIITRNLTVYISNLIVGNLIVGNLIQTVVRQAICELILQTIDTNELIMQTILLLDGRLVLLYYIYCK